MQQANNGLRAVGYVSAHFQGWRGQLIVERVRGNVNPARCPWFASPEAGGGLAFSRETLDREPYDGNQIGRRWRGALSCGHAAALPSPALLEGTPPSSGASLALTPS